MPTTLQQEARKHFQSFELPEKYVGKNLSGVVLDVKTVREMSLSNIYSVLAQNAVDPQNIGQNQIGNDDFKNIVVPNLCKIAEDYTLNAPYCSGEGKLPIQEVKPEKSTSSQGTWPIWLKVLLWIVGLSVLAFVGVIVAFAIKAKLREKYDEEE